MDKLTPQARSLNMSKIKSKNTKPELMLRKKLFSKGIRFRIKSKIPGSPDIIITKEKIAIFVNGCFWHGHRCKEDHSPKSNIEFWQNKIKINRERDIKNIKILKTLGWKVVVIWECQIEKNIQQIVDRILNKIKKI
jgi:DNA mismatch endonuclease, patch repair protein